MMSEKIGRRLGGGRRSGQERRFLCLGDDRPATGAEFPFRSGAVDPEDAALVSSASLRRSSASSALASRFSRAASD
jgi:hypothetical protein